MTAQQPLVFDPTDPDTVADPFAIYARLRAEAPVFEMDNGTFVVSTEAGVRAVLQDDERFGALTMPAGRIAPLILATLDPPDHTRLRGLVAGHFRPRTIAALEPVVDAMVDRAFARLVAAGGGDVVETLAIPVPLGVIASLLGVPDDVFEDLRRWSDAMMDVIAITGFGMDPGRAPDAAASVRELFAYVEQLVADRAAAAERGGELDRDGVDIVSYLLTVDEPVSLVEITSIAIFLLVAGHETTANLLAAGIDHLLEHPADAARCAADETALTRLVEELVRAQSPIQRTVRVARHDTEIDGVAIPAGSRILAYIGAANRDPQRFPDPDTVVLDAGRGPHLGFGAGIHYCLGAPLARLEAKVVFRRWLAEMGAARRAPGTATAWRRRPEPRGIERLDISIGTADGPGGDIR